MAQNFLKIFIFSEFTYNYRILYENWNIFDLSLWTFWSIFYASLSNNSGSDDASSEHTNQINFHILVLEKTN